MMNFTVAPAQTELSVAKVTTKYMVMVATMKYSGEWVTTTSKQLTTTS